MDKFFKKVNEDTWKVKVSDVVEQNGGGYSFGFLPRTKSLIVSIFIDCIVHVKISQRQDDNFSIKVIHANNTTTVEFKCFIDPNSELLEYDYPQTSYYTYLSGYIFFKQDCKFKVYVAFIDQQDQYIVNERHEFSTSKFLHELSRLKKERVEGTATTMDKFFKKVNEDTWKVKVSDVVEQNGGGYSFGFLPRTKSLIVSIFIDRIVQVEISQRQDEKFSIKVIYDNNTTTVEFKCFIDPDSELLEYDYPQTSYYTYLSGYIFFKQDCKFKVYVAFIDQQDQYIVNERHEFSTSKFLHEKTASETSERNASKTSKKEIHCLAGLKNKIIKWSSKFVCWWKK